MRILPHNRQHYDCLVVDFVNAYTWCVRSCVEGRSVVNVWLVSPMFEQVVFLFGTVLSLIVSTMWLHDHGISWLRVEHVELEVLA